MQTIIQHPAHRKAAALLLKTRRRKRRTNFRTKARPLDIDGQQRATKYCWLAYQLAWRFARYHARDLPADELISEALFGLTYAAAMYDADRNVPFRVYARMVIRHRLIQAILSWRRAKRIGSFPTINSQDSFEWETQDPLAPEPDINMTAQEICSRIRNALPDRLYQALYLYHAEGCTLQTIGKRMGITSQRVRQIIFLARDRLQISFPQWADLWTTDHNPYTTPRPA